MGPRLSKARVVSVKQIQEIDRIAIEEFGIPSLGLMENAGRAVADEVLKYLSKKKRKTVAIFCGLGNNAGDGFVSARHLLNSGITPKVFFIGQEHQLKTDAAVNYYLLKQRGYAIEEIQEVGKDTVKDLKEADVVVDAIFGVGLNRLIQEPFKSVIQAINGQARYVVSVDIPSGLDGTTGKVFGACVKASVTVTFTCAKQGFFKGQGPKYTGQVKVADIGIPKKIYAGQ